MAEVPTPKSFDPAAPAPGAPCPFCNIASAYGPFPPDDPPAPPQTGQNKLQQQLQQQQQQQQNQYQLDPDRTAPAAFVVLSTPSLLAFLDIMPLSRGHLLLCPRAHRAKLTDVTAAEAAELGAYLRVLSRALVRATGVQDWNVVQNNGAAAAQVVNHVHYHLIPRPEIRASGRFSESFTMFGRGIREELDDDEAAALAGQMREAIATVLLEEASMGKL
jgi:diadenosine tetraphosphate (Ap4A) HIT family hydrolase